MNIAIFGATSAIAKEYARSRALHLDTITLIARNADSLAEIAQDLKVRGAKSVEEVVHDFSDLEQLSAVVDLVFKIPVDVALVAYGTLPDQERNKVDLDYMQKHFCINATSTILLLSLLSNQMKAKRSGTIAVITSVAADRGKASNYFYGAAKASVSLFAQGLRQDLFSSGVHVLEIKPGFVDTPMTSEFKKNFLWAKPDFVARSIDRAIQKQKNIVYIPFFWRWIMLIIKSIPEFLFKKLRM